MKVWKIALSVLIAFALTVAPFALVIGIAVLTPSQYSNTFVGALNEKYERLHSIEEDKIVVVGGSSVAFGLDSSIVEKYTGMPVVNFGLYAALGTKLMLDLSRSAISEGDIVVISPELDPQTLSLYFSSEQTLIALDDDFSMIWDIPSDNIPSLLGGMWGFAADKLGYLTSGSAPNPSGVYNAANFNEYGDLVYSRPANLMDVYYDENTLINLAPETLDEDFIDYLNEYVDHCKKKGATVIFSFCPMNEMAVNLSESYASPDEFTEYLASRLNCEISGDIDDYIMEAGYFYDTNFHLNDAGVVKRSVTLTRDILFVLEIPRAIEVDIPDAPPLPNSDVKYFGEEDVNAQYFTYEKRENGSYRITGLSEEGKKRFSVTLPLGYNGYKVASIGPNAFAGGELNKVTIPENTNIRVIENGAFSNAPTINTLEILYPVADDIIPPTDFIGVSANFRVYVPRSANYDTQYNWVEVKGIKRILTFIEGK